MKLYVLYTSYPFEGGYVHGVFSSRELAEKYLNDEEYDGSCIQEIELDKVSRWYVEI